jgi:hypothetical protein
MKSIFHSPIRMAALATCLAAPLAAPSALAFTPSGNPVADAFLAILETDNGKVESYESVNESGDTVTIKGLMLSTEGADSTKASIASTTLQSGSVLDNGRLKVGDLTMESLDLKADDGDVTIGSFAATELVLPTPEELEAADDSSVIGPSYGTLEILDVSMADEDGNRIELGRLFTAIDEMDGDMPTASRFAIDALKVDAENLDDEGKKALADLGYERLVISAEGQGRWDPDAATATVENLVLSGEDAATLSLSLKLGGVTRDLVAKLGVIKSGEQALGLMQGVSVQNLTINLANSSLVERILDMQAREAGTDRNTLVQQLNAGLPLMLAALQNQAFQDKVASAASSFLTDPKSLMVSVSPANPVPVAQIMGAAMMAPQSLPDILGVDIVANQAN